MKEKKDINSNSKNNESNLSLTKQQKFNFYKNTIYDDEDNERKNNKTRTRSLKVELLKVMKQRNKYKKLLFLFAGLFIVVTILLSMYIVLNNNNKNNNETKKIKEVYITKKPIVFLGDSITDFYDIRRFFNDKSLINSGFSGYRTTDIINYVDNMVYQFNPSKVFLLIGVNDTLPKFSMTSDDIAENIKKIIESIKQNTTNCKIYVESIYPINNTDNEKIEKSMVDNRSNTKIKEINKKIEEYTKDNDITYIDLYSKLEDEEGNLKLEYTKEGLHISEEGYKVITEELKKYMK